jgi:hypothetical protein
MARSVAGSGKARLNVVVVPIQLAFQQSFHVPAIALRDPTAFAEQVGQQNRFTTRAHRTGFDELALVDEIGLQGQHAEE